MDVTPFTDVTPPLVVHYKPPIPSPVPLDVIYFPITLVAVWLVVFISPRLACGVGVVG